MANGKTLIIESLNGRAQRASRIIAVVVSAIAGVPTSSAADEVLPRALIVENNSRALSLISFQDGSLRKSAEFRQKPLQLLVSPDASKAALITKPENGATRETLYFIDTRNLAILGSTTLDGALWGYAAGHPVQAWWNSNSTRFTIFLEGRGKLDSRLVQIASANGEIVGQLVLAKNSVAKITGLIVVTQGKRIALTYQPMKFSKVKGFTPDEKQATNDLLLVDLDELNATRRVALPGHLVDTWLGKDAQYLQVVMFGKDRKLSNSLSTMSVDRLAEVWKDDSSAGYAFASSLMPDETLIGVRGLGRESALLILRGDQVTQRMTLPDAPRSIRVSDKTKRAYITCSESLQVVDLLTFKIVGSVPTPHLHPSFWSSGSGDSRSMELILTNSEDRGYLTYEGDDEVSALDLSNFKLIKTFRLQSEASKFGKAMLSAAVAGAIGGLATAGANAAGSPGVWMVTSIPLPPSYMPRDAVLDKGERVLYLLQPDGVSVVDTDQLKRTKVLPMRDGIKAANAAFFLTNDLESSNRLIVSGFIATGGILLGDLGPKKMIVNIFDVTSGERLTGVDVPRYDLSYAGGGKYVMDHDGKAVRLRNAKSFEVIKSVETTGSIVEVVWIEK